jgi:hypothetical protein
MVPRLLNQRFLAAFEPVGTKCLINGAKPEKFPCEVDFTDYPLLIGQLPKCRPSPVMARRLATHRRHQPVAGRES